jgi:hypothetical protein
MRSRPGNWRKRIELWISWKFKICMTDSIRHLLNNVKLKKNLKKEREWKQRKSHDLSDAVPRMQISSICCHWLLSDRPLIIFPFDDVIMEICLLFAFKLWMVYSVEAWLTNWIPRKSQLDNIKITNREEDLFALHSGAFSQTLKYLRNSPWVPWIDMRVSSSSPETAEIQWIPPPISEEGYGY